MFLDKLRPIYLPLIKLVFKFLGPLLVIPLNKRYDPVDVGIVLLLGFMFTRQYVDFR